MQALRAFFGDEKVQRLRVERIIAYRESRQDEEIENGTINEEIAVLRRILARAQMKFELKALPVGVRPGE